MMHIGSIFVSFVGLLVVVRFAGHVLFCLLVCDVVLFKLINGF